MSIYSTLLESFGPQGWWPGETRLEIMVGAILTQAVSWRNVEKAIKTLKNLDLLDLTALMAINEDELAEIIKTTLYHRQKARKIKSVLNFISNSYHGNLDLMFSQPLKKLRAELLSVWGIGEETADSILLYAGNYLIFVVDAYTRRILSRLGMVTAAATYAEVQLFMQQRVVPEVKIYNEYHALLVALGAEYCKKTKPLCSSCPLSKNCRYFLAQDQM